MIFLAFLYKNRDVFIGLINIQNNVQSVLNLLRFILIFSLLDRIDVQCSKLSLSKQNLYHATTILVQIMGTKVNRI